MTPTPRPEPPVILTLRNCPKCGVTHIGMEFRRLPRPNENGFTHWGTCPTTDKVVLSRNDREAPAAR